MNRFMNLKTEYKCWADHIGRKTGYKHYHCYARFKSSKKEQTMRNKFGMNIRMMNGDDFENANYISEKGTNTSFQELGHKKTDDEKDGIGKMRKYLESGMTMGEAIRTDPDMHVVADRHRYSLCLFKLELEKEQIKASHKHVIDGISDVSDIKTSYTTTAPSRLVVSRVANAAERAHISPVQHLV